MARRCGWSEAPALVAGEEVRFEPDGPWQKVARVTPCAAYVRALFVEPKVVELRDGRTFTVKASGTLVPVSVHSFVYERR